METKNKKEGFAEIYEMLIVPGAVFISLLCIMLALSIYNYYRCYCPGECLLTKVLMWIFFIATLVLGGYLGKEIYDSMVKKGVKVPDKKHDIRTLYSYMDKVLRLKHDPAAIKRNLLNVGWTKEEIEKVYIETKEKIAKEKK